VQEALASHETHLHAVVAENTELRQSLRQLEEELTTALNGHGLTRGSLPSLATAIPATTAPSSTTSTAPSSIATPSSPRSNTASTASVSSVISPLTPLPLSKGIACFNKRHNMT
jgi:hypothetical protein